jgi:hypothetical protein
MMDQAQTNRALEKLADSFLQDTRTVSESQSGWGQFVGQTGGTQVGLYGTCAGTVVVATAYGHTRVPQPAVAYLIQLWNDRNVAGTNGARYFALTTRLAFCFMALRHSAHPSLASTTMEIDHELRGRILNDGLLVSWQIDSETKSATGDEFSTAIAILAYGLTAKNRNGVPAQIHGSAESLQSRIEGSAPLNLGVRKFYLTAVATVLDRKHLSRSIKRLVRLSKVHQHSRDQDSLYFWDYSYLGPEGKISRRDYFHVPSDAVDILLACTSVAGLFQKLAALDLVAEDTKSILDTGLYFAGRELAGSNNQAWISLALLKARSLATADTPVNRRILKYFSGIPENVMGGVVVPCFVLILSALASAAPDRILEVLQWIGLIGPTTPSWWGKTSVAVQVLGLIVLTAWGAPLATRVLGYVRSRLP